MNPYRAGISSCSQAPRLHQYLPLQKWKKLSDQPLAGFFVSAVSNFSPIDDKTIALAQSE
jgi:hypothetical protein